MPVGFIKTVGGQKRLRWMRSGYNADNLSLPQNVVVFDSAVANVYGVLLTGMWTGTPPASLTKIVSWPSYGYVPLVSFLYSDLNTPGDEWQPMFAHAGGTAPQELSVTDTGIFFQFSGNGALYPCSLRYIVHGMPA